MKTVDDLRAYCKQNKIKFSLSEQCNKITLTKTKTIKMVLTYHRVMYYLWDNQRKSYNPKKEDHMCYFGSYLLKDDVEIIAWRAIIDLLETETNLSEASDSFPIQKQKFDAQVLTAWNDGDVTLNTKLLRAYIIDIMKVTYRGSIEKLQVEDSHDAWWLIGGHDHWKSDISFLYDGEEYFVSIKKYGKKYRIAHRQISMTPIDKCVVDAALKIYLEDKDGSG